MIQDILAVQHEVEGNLLALQPAVEQTALQLHKANRELMTQYLTDYCVSHGEMVVKRWGQLGRHLIQKYNDGYVQDDKHNPQEVGYPQEWLRRVINERPEQFRLPEKADDVPESKLVD
jgi:hypothetical protein